MKNLVYALISLALLLFACGKGSNDNKDQIQMDYNSISEQLIEIGSPIFSQYVFEKNRVTKGGEDKTLSDIKDEIEASINANDSLKQVVSKIWVEDDAIVVDNKEGLFSFIVKPNETYDLDLERIRQAFRNINMKNKSSIKKICVLFQGYSFADEQKNNQKQVYSQLGKYASAKSISIDFFEYENFNIDVLKYVFLKYDAIIFASHGKFVNGLHWLETGEQFTLNNSQKYKSEFKNQRIMGGTFILNGKPSNTKYLLVSEKYLDKYYKDNSIPKSIIYFLACELFKNNTKLGDILIKKGAGQVWGWDNSVVISDIVAGFVLYHLINGESSEQVFQNLQSDCVDIISTSFVGEKKEKICNLTVDPKTNAKLKVISKK